MKNEIKSVKIEENKRYIKYTDIMKRATMMGLMNEDENLNRMMDIESADKKFDLRLEDWLKTDDFNFSHDFLGIRDNINRNTEFPATDFGVFIPRFASRNN